MKINNFFIDNFLGGIIPNEFMVAAGYVGTGKTSLSHQIAFDAAEIGLKPALLSLENSEFDTLKLRAFKLWKEFTNNFDIKFREWQTEQFANPDDACVKAYRQAEADLKKFILIENCNVAYKITDLIQDLDKAKQRDASFIILDHLDYIETVNPNNTWGELKNHLYVIKNWIENNNIPVIAFSQFIKRPEGKIVPMISDIAGSADKGRIATSVFVITRDFDADQVSQYLFPTLFVARKDRYGTLINNGVRVNYDSRSNRYDWHGAENIKTNYLGDKVENV